MYGTNLRDAYVLLYTYWIDKGVSLWESSITAWVWTIIHQGWQEFKGTIFQNFVKTTSHSSRPMVLEINLMPYFDMKPGTILTLDLIWFGAKKKDEELNFEEITLSI